MGTTDTFKPKRLHIDGRYVLLVPELPTEYLAANLSEPTYRPEPPTFDGRLYSYNDPGCTGCAFRTPGGCFHPKHNHPEQSVRHQKECWGTTKFLLPFNDWDWYMMHRTIAASQGYEVLRLEERNK